MLLGLFGLASVGLIFANIGKPYEATQPVGSVIAYLLLFFLTFLGLLGLIRSSILKKAIPFTTGSYVFASDTIIARDRTLAGVRGHGPAFDELSSRIQDEFFVAEAKKEATSP